MCSCILQLLTEQLFSPFARHCAGTGVVLAERECKGRKKGRGKFLTRMREHNKAG